VNTGDLRDAVEARIDRIGAEDVVGRIWRRDHTVWGTDPTEIADRLGWLDVHTRMREHVAGLRAFARDCADDGLRTAVLLGMGGSSLAPEVFRDSFGVASGALDLVVLDSTHPDQVLAVDRAVDPARTLFVVASKSGTTVETTSHLAHFRQRVPDGSRFVAITDPGTPLAATAADQGFRRVFENPPDIGGRYSALSFFGLVPAALIDADLGALLDGAVAMAGSCGVDVDVGTNPAARLGAWLGEAATAGRDKLTPVVPAATRSTGAWLEQLVAESTGKDGTGVVPVDGERIGSPAVYGDDRFFVAAGDVEGGAAGALDRLEAAGHPALRWPGGRARDLGAEMFRWELATAVAGHVLGVRPFDQPDVQSAKDATARFLASGTAPVVEAGDLDAVVGSVGRGDYVAIQAYLPRNPAMSARLAVVRERIRAARRVAVTIGFGPRFLHSTGQLHKGGPDSAVCIQVVGPPAEDIEIPGRDITFGELLAAQAAGDLEALRSRGRRAVRVRLDELEAVTWA
jgi:glucose-6-phosphate isomerase